MFVAQWEALLSLYIEDNQREFKILARNYDGIGALPDRTKKEAEVLVAAFKLTKLSAAQSSMPSGFWEGSISQE